VIDWVSMPPPSRSSTSSMSQLSLPICSRRSRTAVPLSKPPMSAASRAALMMSAAVLFPMSAVFDSSAGLATAIDW